MNFDYMNPNLCREYPVHQSCSFESSSCFSGFQYSGFNSFFDFSPHSFDKVNLPFNELRVFTQLEDQNTHTKQTSQIKKVIGVVRRTKVNQNKIKKPYERAERIKKLYKNIQQADLQMDERRSRNNDSQKKFSYVSPIVSPAAAAAEIPFNTSFFSIDEKVKQYILFKNYKGNVNNFHVQPLEIQNALCIESDCDFYDNYGNFIIGVRFNVEGIEESCKNLITLPQPRYNVPAAGLPNDSELNRIKEIARTKIVLKETNGYFYNGRTEHAHTHFQSFFRTCKTIQVFNNPRMQTKMCKLLPIINGLSQAFKKHWPKVYEVHDKGIHDEDYDKYYIGKKSVFSTLDMTCHQIGSKGAIKNNGLHGYHRTKEYLLNSYCFALIQQLTVGGYRFRISRLG